MECRRSLVLALGLLTGVGCTHPFAFLRSTGSPAGKDDEITHKAPTYVAFAEFRVLSASDPKYPPDAQQQFLEDARLSFLKALEVDPKCVPAMTGLARLQLRLGDVGAAEGTFLKVLELQPRDAALWSELGMCQARKRDFAAAVDSLRKAVELSPGNRQYRTTLGYMLAYAGRMEESFATLVATHGEARAHLDMARMYRHHNQPQRAREHVARSLELDPHSPSAYRLLAEVDGKAATPDIRTVDHTEPAPPAPPNTPATQPSAASTGPKPSPRLIRVPPLPVTRPSGD